VNGLANLGFADFWGLAILAFAIFGGLANLFANLFFLNDK